MKLNKPNKIQTQTQTNPSIHSTESTRLRNLQREREGMLARFEREQREQEQLKQNAIQREIEEQQKKYQEEQEKIRIQKMKDLELERIVTMFNVKDLPEFHIGMYTDTGCGNGCYYDFISGTRGYCGNYGNQLKLLPNGCYKFQFSLADVKKIQEFDKNKLYKIYTKLCEDFMWIQKYAYGFKNSNPFVDYVYDYGEKNNKLIEDCNNQVKQYEIQYKSYPHENTLNTLNQWNECLKELIKFKTILTKLDKPREYYYVNYEEFLDLFEKKNMHGYREFMQPAGNLDSIQGGNYGMNGWLRYEGNKYYHHIWHVWDREKLNKLSFLDITKDFFEPIMFKYNIYYHDNSCSSYFYDMEKQFILAKKKNCNTGISMFRSNPINKEDFDKFINITKIIVELIEFVRPDMILMSQQEN